MPQPAAIRFEAFRAHQELVAGLQPLGASETRPRNTFLFRQGEPSRGGYLLEEGEAKLLLLGDDGRIVAARTVGAGYLLGLPGTILNQSYLFTAKLTRDSRVSFIPTQSLLDFLRVRSDLCFDIVEMLGGELLDLQHTVVRHARRSKRPRTNA